MSVGRPTNALGHTCPKCGAQQESPGSTVCEQCGTDLLPAGAVRPAAPRRIPQFGQIFQVPARIGKRAITVLDAGVTALERGIYALIGVITALIRVIIVLVLFGSLIIGLGFVPQVSARVPGLKTVSETALKAVSTTGKKALQRAQEWGSGALSRRQSLPADTTKKPAQKVAKKAAPGRTVAAQPLTVKSRPSGATVQLNARPVGKTPVTLKLAAGTYKVTITRSGYVAVTRTVTMKKGQAASLNVSLSVARPTPRQAAPPSAQKAPTAGPRARRLLEIGVQAPAIVLKDSSDAVHRLRDLRGRQVVVLFIWSLDAHAKRLIDELDAHVRNAGGDRPALVVLLTGDGAALRKFETATGVRVPILLGDEEIARAYGITKGTTVLYVVSGSGLIAQRQVSTIQLGLIFQRQRDER